MTPHARSSDGVQRPSPWQSSDVSSARQVRTRAVLGMDLRRSDRRFRHVARERPARDRGHRRAARLLALPHAHRSGDQRAARDRTRCRQRSPPGQQVRSGDLGHHSRPCLALEFVVGITLAVVFATTVFQWLPAVAVTEPGVGPWNYPRELILPVITLVIAVVPYTARIMRASTVEILESDFVEMARLKGCPRAASSGVTPCRTRSPRRSRSPR